MVGAAATRQQTELNADLRMTAPPTAPSAGYYRVVDILFMGGMDAHQSFDRFDHALGVADQIAVGRAERVLKPHAPARTSYFTSVTGTSVKCSSCVATEPRSRLRTPPSPLVPIMMYATCSSRAKRSIVAATAPRSERVT
jgi:hypothetical protein